jgi:hypothetical protein
VKASVGEPVDVLGDGFQTQLMLIRHETRVSPAEPNPMIRQCHKDNIGVYCARKIHAKLNRKGNAVARCTVEPLMKAEAVRTPQSPIDLTLPYPVPQRLRPFTNPPARRFRLVRPETVPIDSTSSRFRPPPLTVATVILTPGRIGYGDEVARGLGRNRAVDDDGPHAPGAISS